MAAKNPWADALESQLNGDSNGNGVCVCVCAENSPRSCIIHWVVSAKIVFGLVWDDARRRFRWCLGFMLTRDGAGRWCARQMPSGRLWGMSPTHPILRCHDLLSIGFFLSRNRAATQWPHSDLFNANNFTSEWHYANQRANHDGYANEADRPLHPSRG